MILYRIDRDYQKPRSGDDINFYFLNNITIEKKFETIKNILDELNKNPFRNIFWYLDILISLIVSIGGGFLTNLIWKKFNFQDEIQNQYYYSTFS